MSLPAGQSTQLIAEVTFWGMEEGAQTTLKPHREKAEGGGESREGRAAQRRRRGLRSGRRWRGGGCCSSAVRMRCSCDSRARSDVQENRLSW